MISKSTVVEFWVKSFMAAVIAGSCCHAFSSEIET